MKVQQETWDKELHPDIDVIYYHGGYHIDDYTAVGKKIKIKSKNGNNPRNYELSVDCSDAYEMMHWKFKLALDAIDYHQYDTIFRTNSCSYIVKDRILQIADIMPRTGCYAGYHNGTYISGAGIFFTPDVLDSLRNELTDKPHGAEDVLIGSILAGKVNMITENSRIDAGVEGFERFDSYHFRAKTSNDLKDRGRDIEALKKLHEKLIK